jgi:biopolymer transport protein ExbD
MIPMIDLLMVTIAFLLVTAVWSHLNRINASANVPGERGPTPPKVEPRLHLEMRDPAKFVLHWNEGASVIRSIDLPRNAVIVPGDPAHPGRTVRFPELAAKLGEEWRAAGVHKEAGDREVDQIVLHTDNETPYGTLIGVIDAAYEVKRPTSSARGAGVSAFNVTFATD